MPWGIFLKTQDIHAKEPAKRAPTPYIPIAPAVIASLSLPPCQKVYTSTVAGMYMCTTLDWRRSAAAFSCMAYMALAYLATLPSLAARWSLPTYLGAPRTPTHTPLYRKPASWTSATPAGCTAVGNT